MRGRDPNPSPSPNPNQVHPLPALEPMFQSEALAALLRGYLGGPVRYDGHFSFKLLNGITPC